VGKIVEIRHDGCGNSIRNRKVGGWKESTSAIHHSFFTSVRLFDSTTPHVDTDHAMRRRHISKRSTYCALASVASVVELQFCDFCMVGSRRLGDRHSWCQHCASRGEMTLDMTSWFLLVQHSLYSRRGPALHRSPPPVDHHSRNPFEAIRQSAQSRSADPEVRRRFTVRESLH